MNLELILIVECKHDIFKIQKKCSGKNLLGMGLSFFAMSKTNN